MARRTWLVVAAAVLCATAAGAEKYSPFKVPRDQIVAKVKTIALHSTPYKKDDALSDSAVATFDAMITAELQAAGFQVVPSVEYGRVWKAGADSLGGLFNASTGVLDTSKVRPLHDATVREMRDRFRADAILHSSFQRVRASFSGGNAHWDGVKQRMTKGFRGFLGANNSYGTVPALSLVAVMEDVDGNNLYVDSGGLVVVVRYDGSKFIDLPDDSLFSNPKRNTEAVRLALGALTRPKGK